MTGKEIEQKNCFPSKNSSYSDILRRTTDGMETMNKRSCRFCWVVGDLVMYIHPYLTIRALQFLWKRLWTDYLSRTNRYLLPFLNFEIWNYDSSCLFYTHVLPTPFSCYVKRHYCLVVWFLTPYHIPSKDSPVRKKESRVQYFQKKETADRNKLINVSELLTDIKLKSTRIWWFVCGVHANTWRTSRKKLTTLITLIEQSTTLVTWVRNFDYRYLHTRSSPTVDRQDFLSII